MSHHSEGSLNKIFSDDSVTMCDSFSFCQDEISALRRRLEKSEKERNELRQTTDSLETKVCVASQSHTHTNPHMHTHIHTRTLLMFCVQVTAVTSELSDERFRGDAVGQALDVERAERLRLFRENKELQVDSLRCFLKSNLLLRREW